MRFSHSARLAPVLLGLVFLVSLNLRPSLTTVGPLLPVLSAELRLDEGAQGLLGAIPILAFAAASPFVPRLAQRWGPDRTILAAMLTLACGVLLRSYAGLSGLWAGTIVLGAAIAACNVLVPVLVRRDYSYAISRATSISSTCITGGAAIASGVAVPLSHAFGWRGALAFWALPALLVAVLWIPRLGMGRDDDTATAPIVEGIPARTVWLQPTAWWVTLFMGIQSTSYYIMVTWLPTIEATVGVSKEDAGLHLFFFQIVGIGSGLWIPRLMKRPESQVAAAVTVSAPIVVGALGMLLAPQFIAGWAIIIGLGTGASLVVALSIIGYRGRSGHETVRLSGMAQSVGYLLAACGPLLAGMLAEWTGGWTATMILLLCAGLAQLALAVPAGRGRR